MVPKAIDTAGYVAPEALLGLGDCYAAGHGVEQNWTKAVELYHKAADMSDPQAQYMLARCYAEGNGVGQDMAEAVKLYKRAATNVCETRGILVMRELCAVWLTATPTATV